MQIIFVVCNLIVKCMNGRCRLRNTTCELHVTAKYRCGVQRQCNTRQVSFDSCVAGYGMAVTALEEYLQLISYWPYNVTKELKYRRTENTPIVTIGGILCGGGALCLFPFQKGGIFWTFSMRSCRFAIHLSPLSISYAIPPPYSLHHITPGISVECPQTVDTSLYLYLMLLFRLLFRDHGSILLPYRIVSDRFNVPINTLHRVS